MANFTLTIFVISKKIIFPCTCKQPYRDNSHRNLNYPVMYPPLKKSHPRCIWLSSFRIQSKFCFWHFCLLFIKESVASDRKWCGGERASRDSNSRRPQRNEQYNYLNHGVIFIFGWTVPLTWHILHKVHVCCFLNASNIYCTYLLALNTVINK